LAVRRLNPDLVVAFLAALIGAGTLLLLPDQISGETLAAITNPQSPAFFPILAACILLFCSFWLGAKAINDQRERRPLEVRFTNLPLVLLTMGLFVATAVSIHYFGLVLTAVAAILIMAWLLEFRDLRVLLPVAIGVPLGIYLLFERLLLIILPRGAFFS
jgi:putative tricarboxylic transport membrane protein